MRHRSFLKFACLGLHALWIGEAARGANFVVSNLNNAGAGSLRQAIIDANAGAGADTITFQAGVAGTIQLASALPTIAGDLTLTGPGAASVTVSGNNANRIFFVESGTVTIGELTLANGRATGGAGGQGAGGGGGGLGAGAALFVNAGATVTMQNVEFTAHAAVGGAGGAVASREGGGGGGGLGGAGGSSPHLPVLPGAAEEAEEVLPPRLPAETGLFPARAVGEVK